MLEDCTAPGCDDREEDQTRQERRVRQKVLLRLTLLLLVGVLMIASGVVLRSGATSLLAVAGWAALTVVGAAIAGVAGYTAIMARLLLWD